MQKSPDKWRDMSRCQPQVTRCLQECMCVSNNVNISYKFYQTTSPKHAQDGCLGWTSTPQTTQCILTIRVTR